MTLSTGYTGKAKKVGNDEITKGEKRIYAKIEKYLNKKGIKFYDIWVHEVNGGFYIGIGEDSLFRDLEKYGYSIKNQIIFSNILRFIFKNITPDEINIGFYKIGGI